MYFSSFYFFNKVPVYKIRADLLIMSSSYHPSLSVVFCRVTWLWPYSLCIILINLAYSLRLMWIFHVIVLAFVNCTIVNHCTGVVHPDLITPPFKFSQLYISISHTLDLYNTRNGKTVYSREQRRCPHMEKPAAEVFESPVSFLWHQHETLLHDQSHHCLIRFSLLIPDNQISVFRRKLDPFCS